MVGGILITFAMKDGMVGEFNYRAICEEYVDSTAGSSAKKIIGGFNNRAICEEYGVVVGGFNSRVICEEYSWWILQQGYL